MPTATIDRTLQMHYELDDFTPPWSTAETVLFVHGQAKSGRLWQFWVPPLAGRYRLLRPDNRGFGSSSPIPDGYRYSLSTLTNDLRLLLDRLGIERVHVIGETFGGPTAMHFAYEYPDRVQTLTLSGAPYRLNTDPAHFDEARRLILDEGVRAWAHGQGERRFGPGADPALVNWYCDEMGKTSRRSVLALYDYVTGVDLTDILPHILAPTLVLAGTASVITPIEEARACAGLIPNARIVEIEGGPNQVHITHLEQCVEAFLRFTEEVA